jgi:hypothetical protein
VFTLGYCIEHISYANLNTRGIIKTKIMFRKIVSNLSFSPALVGQLGFYAKRLRKEEATRKMGLVFVVLALIVQSLVIFQPPESANASNQNDFVPGGLGLGANKSLNNFLAPYDANSNNLQDVMNYVGITRAEITAAQFGSWTTPGTLSWGFQPRFSAAQGEQAVAVTGPSGNAITTVYARPMTLLNGNDTIYGWVGQSAKIGWFAIMQACGNLVTKTVPPPPPTPPAKIELSKTATNISQGLVDATTLIAKENDQIKFTITAKNSGGTTAPTKIQDNLADTLEYATLFDNGGGTFNTTTKVLSWPDVTLKPGETQSRTFVIRVLDVIPTTPSGQSDPTSFDCYMMNVFGNNVTVRVDCQPPKEIEHIVTQLPHTGPTENLIFAGIVLSVVTYFYVRSRQIGKEVHLIRRDLNAGTI